MKEFGTLPQLVRRLMRFSSSSSSGSSSRSSSSSRNSKASVDQTLNDERKEISYLNA